MVTMRIELSNQTAALLGDRNAVALACIEAIEANGARVVADASRMPDMLVASLPLVPADGVEIRPLLQEVNNIADGMVARGKGRILFLLSAAAAMPMRRHADYSVQMAAALAGMRALAMRSGPSVLVNAVGVGLVGEPIVAGDAAMLGHASVGRPGNVGEVVSTALFFLDPLNTYATGQMLSVDGGWSAGYGRNF